MRFIYDNIVAIIIAVFASTLAWVLGGTYGNMLLPVIPWLWAILAEAMICFPQRHAGETTYEARERVWGDMKRDPLLPLGIILIAILLVPFLNRGLCPTCDYSKILLAFETQSTVTDFDEFLKIATKPPIPFVPSCVDRMAHLNVVTWFIPALTAMFAAKHSLLTRGKRLLLRMLVVNGVALAFVGMLQQTTGATAPLWLDIPNPGKAYFFSTFGYPNMGGDYFTTLFALAVGLWRWDIMMADREFEADAVATKDSTRYHQFWKRHIMAVPAAILFLAAVATLSRAAILLASSLAFFFFLHGFCSYMKRLDRAGRVRASATCACGLVLIAIFIFVFTPDDVRKETDSINTTEVLDRLSGRGQYHARVATEIWKEYWLFGCGGWGYKHLCIQKMTPEELRHMQMVGGINVHNDFLQFLAEHGIVGFGLMVAIVFLLIKPLGRVWKALMDSIRFTPPKKQPPKPHLIFVLPAPVFCILAAAVATVIHAFGDCPLRSPAVLMLFFLELACMDGFLPRLRESNN